MQVTSVKMSHWEEYPTSTFFFKITIVVPLRLKAASNSQQKQWTQRLRYRKIYGVNKEHYSDNSDCWKNMLYNKLKYTVVLLNTVYDSK